jgi:hypothetical protein
VLTILFVLVQGVEVHHQGDAMFAGQQITFPATVPRKAVLSSNISPTSIKNENINYITEQYLKTINTTLKNAGQY